MNEFCLDGRLDGDCELLCSLPLSELLLMNNALYAWFILVPRRSVLELHELSLSDQQLLLIEYNVLSRFVKRRFDVHKLNTGALGNVVSQLHLHVIGRREGDSCWPQPVWGQAPHEAYSRQHVAEIKQWALDDVFKEVQAQIL